MDVLTERENFREDTQQQLSHIGLRHQKTFSQTVFQDLIFTTSLCHYKNNILLFVNRDLNRLSDLLKILGAGGSALG